MSEFDDIDKDINEFEESTGQGNTDSLNDFASDVKYDKYIILPKRDILTFCRVIDPVTKLLNDEYGKLIYVKPIDSNRVELLYWNNPYRAGVVIENKSGKTVSPFLISVANLKKLTGSAFTSLVFVQENNQMNLLVCGALLYVETKDVATSFYRITQGRFEGTIDKTLAEFTFKKVGQIIACSERMSEKVMIVKNNQIVINTGFFVARVNSPFGQSEDFIMYKAVIDVLSILADISKSDLRWRYSVSEKDGGMLYISCDNNLYFELPTIGKEKIPEFYNPEVARILNFEANIVIVNDAILRLTSIVKLVDYLADSVSIEFGKRDIVLKIYSTDMSKSTSYKFPITEDVPSMTGEMRQNVNVVSTFLNLCGTDVKYSFNDDGLGVANKDGAFLIRRNS